MFVLVFFHGRSGLKEKGPYGPFCYWFRFALPIYFLGVAVLLKGRLLPSTGGTTASDGLSWMNVPADGGAPGSFGPTGMAVPGGGTKVGAGLRSDGGMGMEPEGARGIPAAPTDGIGATAAGAAFVSGATYSIGPDGVCGAACL